MATKVILLDNWIGLNKGLKQLNEEEAKELLEVERKGQKRQSYLLRIYGRYNTLRTKRERKQLMSE